MRSNPMVRCRATIGISPIPLLVLLASLSFGAAALATDGDVCGPGDCVRQCHEARHVCQAVAHRAMGACHEACREGDTDCRHFCRMAYTRAHAVCAEERFECRLACRGDVDRECVVGCLDDLSLCRDEAAECRATCRKGTAPLVEKCRDLAAGGAPPEEVKACIREAGEAHALCHRACSEKTGCGEQFRRCIPECSIEGDTPE